jgi:hypothetical protein
MVELFYGHFLRSPDKILRNGENTRKGNSLEHLDVERNATLMESAQNDEKALFQSEDRCSIQLSYECCKILQSNNGTPGQISRAK